MNILIVGMGNGGTTIAADLTLKGHKVTLLKSSKSINNDNFEYIKNHENIVQYESDGAVNECRIHMVTDSFDEAFSCTFDLIIVYIQTNYHEDLVKRMSGYLSPGQLILLEPGYLSTAYFMKYCRDKNLIICEAQSSPIDCRITAPGKVKALFKNVRNPIGVYPAEKTDFAMNVLKELGFNFTRLESVVEAALHNPNLIVHTVGAIMSIPRIEYTKGRYSMYREVFTPGVWNLVEKLDMEKKDVLSALGLEKMSYVDACKFRNSEDQSADSKTIFFDYALNHSPDGPSVSNSRYITEDVSEGLVLLESLGSVYNIDTPVATALIDIASACLNTDFRKGGRTVDRLGRENIIEVSERK